MNHQFIFRSEILFGISLVKQNKLLFLNQMDLVEISLHGCKEGREITILL
jgi:hypothetical protein